MNVDFLANEGVVPPNIRRGVVRQWLQAVARRHDRRIGELVYQFCSDAQILEANRQYLDHDYYTDIITFDYSEGDRVSGDMFVGLETIATNAEQLGVPEAEELHRVLVHGLLHLIGLGDKTESEAARMRRAEDEALAMLHVQLEGRSLLKY